MSFPHELLNNLRLRIVRNKDVLIIINSLFQFGIKLKHCIFTNMTNWNQIKNKQTDKQMDINQLHLCYSKNNQAHENAKTCSNDHLYKTTTRLRRPVLSPPKQIPTQSLLVKTTTCLTWPATTFCVSQMKKTCLKLPLQNFTQRRNGKQSYMETMHKK